VNTKARNPVAGDEREDLRGAPSSATITTPPDAFSSAVRWSGEAFDRRGARRHQGPTSSTPSTSAIKEGGTKPSAPCVPRARPPTRRRSAGPGQVTASRQPAGGGERPAGRSLSARDRRDHRRVGQRPLPQQLCGIQIGHACVRRALNSARAPRRNGA